MAANSVSTSDYEAAVDGGQGSSSHDQHRDSGADEYEELSVLVQSDATVSTDSSVVEWINSIRTGKDGRTGEPIMKSVPRVLKQIKHNKGCFDPLLISIGPYHHWNKELESAERFKLELTSKFLPDTEKLLAAYEEVKKVAKEARKCYPPTATSNFTEDDETSFTKMLFLDGCFVLQYMYCMVRGRQSEMNMKNHEIAFIQRDLFLLENQLPFQVLRPLMILKFGSAEIGLEMINQFIARARGLSADEFSQLKMELAAQNEVDFEHPIHHLLDLLWRQLIDICAFGPEIRRTKRDTCQCWPFKARDQSEDDTGAWYSFRSAKELKTAGLHFRRSKTRRFTDVKYESQLVRGILRLPPLTVDDNTKSLLLNLVAYEMSINGPKVFGVSSYLWFMDSLIDEAEDVKELRYRGIIFNCLGSDEEVAKLFNQIAGNLVPDPRAYLHVTETIQRHYEHRIQLWMNEWLYDHFNSPWTILAFLGAIFALALSIIQSYCSLYTC